MTVLVICLDAGVHQQSLALLYVRGRLVFEGQDDLLQNQDQEEAHGHDELRQRELELRAGEGEDSLVQLNHKLEHVSGSAHKCYVCISVIKMQEVKSNRNVFISKKNTQNIFA